MARFVFSGFADEADATIKGQIAALQRNQVGAVELRNVDGKNISDFNLDEAKALKATLDAAGIAVASIGSHYGKVPFDEAKFVQTVAVAKLLGAPYIRMFSFYEGSKAERLASVKRMAELAHAEGVQCCHENELGIFGESPEACKELLEYCGGKLGCIFDFANFLHAGTDIWKAYALLKDSITYFHIKDFRRGEQKIVPAGLGDGDIVAILTDYDKTHAGQVVLSIEPHLHIFEGLAKLEASGHGHTLEQLQQQDKIAFASSTEAFDAAVGALRAVVAEVQPLRLGVIGYGNMGVGHVNNYMEGKNIGLRITAVADTEASKRQAAEEKLPGLQTFANEDALLQSGTVDAILIAVPHYDHPVIAKKAFAKGVHVLTEKPAGVYLKQVNDMNRAAAASGCIFGIMYNQRANPVYQKVRDLVQNGSYGAITRVVWNITNWYRTQQYYNSGDWRATWSGEGGGVLMNQCPHQLDLWQWICGMPSKISAHTHEGKWHDIEVEDDVTIYAEYPNGATGVFIATTGEPDGTNRLEITMDKAKIIVENDTSIALHELWRSTAEDIRVSESGYDFGKVNCQNITCESVDLNIHGGSIHAAVCNHFAAAIAANDPSRLIARGEEGANGLGICNAAYLSSWLGQAVELPVDEELYWAKLQEKIKASRRK